jgi:hypothetical protein
LFGGRVHERHKASFAAIRIPQVSFGELQLCAASFQPVYSAVRLFKDRRIEKYQNNPGESLLGLKDSKNALWKDLVLMQVGREPLPVDRLEAGVIREELSRSLCGANAHS